MSDFEGNINTADFPLGEVVSNSSVVFYQCAAQNGYPIQFMSSNASNVLGFEAQAFESDPALWFSRIHPRDRSELKSSYEQLSDGEATEMEFRFKHKNEKYIWLRGEQKMISDRSSGDTAIAGSLVDISDKKEVEQELRELNQTLEERIRERTQKLTSANRKLKKQVQYRNKVEKKLKKQHKTLKLQELAIDNLNDMVVITKAPKEQPLESEIVFVNKAFIEFTGYAEEELLGRKPTFLHGPETSTEVKNRIEQQIKKHDSLREEFMNYRKDGSTYWVELDMAPFPTTDGDYEYWVGINRDITKRKIAEQKLEESEKRYRAITELSFDAIFELNLDGTINNCNQRASKLFGYSKQELLGMPIKELTAWDKKDLVNEDNAIGEKTIDHTSRRKDGSRFPTEVHTRRYQIGGNEQVIAYVRDKTSQKDFENKIRKSLKEKEILLAEIHHRVKNNLAIISGLLQMQAFNTEDEQLLEKLQESQSRIQSIAMVHEKLYESKSFAEISVDQYIDDLLDVIMNSISSAEKSISIEKDMEHFSMDMSQAIPCGLLLNEIITNSFKHGFRNQKEGRIAISVHQKDKMVVLSVRDNGVGLPEEFDIKKQSSLGMTLIDTLVKQLEGTLETSSDNGAVFTVKFEIDE